MRRVMETIHFNFLNLWRILFFVNRFQTEPPVFPIWKIHLKRD